MMKKRVLAIVAAVVVIGAVAFGIFTMQNRVEVQAGTRVVCSYGHVISEDIQTLRVPASEVAEHRVVTTSELCDRHAKLEALFGEAQEALEAGDVKKAEAKLAEIVALDPAFSRAKEQLDAIAAGNTPQPVGGSTGSGGSGSTGSSGGSGGTGGSTAPPAPDNPGEGYLGGPIGSLIKWLPDEISGYTAQRPAVDVLSIAREYKPDSGSATFSLIIVAEQFRSAKDAEAALEKQIKSVYPKDASTMTVKGRTIYFGTDGRRYAAAGLADGAVMVALEMTPNSGTPKDLKPALEAVLNQLP